MKRKYKTRAVDAQNALSELMREPVAMYAPALAELVGSLRACVATGRTPDLSITQWFAAGVPGISETPDGLQIAGDMQADAMIPRGDYTDRVQLVGGKALIPITGPIYPRPNFITKYYGGTACTDLENDVANAANDPDVSQIIFMVNSPGGSCQGLETTALAIFNARPKIRMDSFVFGVMASAAYYLGSAAHTITAGPSTLTGSIGTILLHADHSGMLAEWGINITEIIFGPHKADGSPFRPLDDQGRATLQHTVDQFGQQFHAAVARHRNVSTDQIIKNFGGGRAFIATEARQRGLIDAVGTIATVGKSNTPQQNDDEGGARTVPPPKKQGDDARVEIVTTTAAQSTRTTKPTAVWTINLESKTMTIDPRVRAQLFALDLIDADADDATAERALRTFCAGAGVAVPETPDGQLRVLRGGQSTTTAGSTAGTTASPNVQAAHDQEFEQARRAGIEAYQNRRTELTELQAMINSGHSQPIISDQLLVTELDAVGADGAFKSIATIRGEWRELMAGHRANQPLTLPPVSQTESAEERFCEHAQLAIMDRLGMLRDDQRPANGFAELATMRLNDIGAMCFRFQNRRLESDHNDREGVALELLTSSQFRPRPFGSRWSPGGVMGAPSAAVSDPSVNRPADYPHLLSGLAARMLDRQIGLARVTYPDWCARKPDLPDFKPTTLSQMGTFHRLDEIQDDDRPKQLKLSEELRGYLQIMRKGNKVGLTVVMQANDDLGGFIQQINTLANAHEITIDIGCLDLLAGNVSLWSDGVALFHATHKNLVTGGGVPSTTQAKKMELIHAKQTGVGTTEFIESTPEIVLVPTDLREQALQTYAPFGQIPEIKQPTTDATINVYRGDVAKIVASARLSSYSTAEWYTFDNPEIYTVIAYAFQSGFRGGRRLTWTDIETGTQWFSLEQRAGWAAMGFRGCAKNPGV